MKLKICEVVSDLQHLPLKKVEEVIKLKLENGVIKDYAYIVHDKDVDEEGKTKYSHFHIALRFTNSYDPKHISQWFGISENFVKKATGTYQDMLLYLTHANAEDKYQYSSDEVKSNFDYKKEIEKIKAKKEMKRIKYSIKQMKQMRKEEIINMIDIGEIREFNKHEKISCMEFVDFGVAIDRAFKYRTDRLIAENKRNLRCIFITGESGAGKTTYAQKLAEKHDYSYYVSSGSNDVLDDYKGQDCLILDDLRPSCMGLSDLLKLLDNHTSSSVKSRYKNKVLECKLIIVTTTLSIENFFNNVFSEEKETIIQLQRRCTTKIMMTVDKMFISYWENKSRKYGNPIVVDNPVKDMFTPVDMTEDEQMEDIRNFLGLDIKEENNSINEAIENNIKNVAIEQVGCVIDKKEFYEFFKILGMEVNGNKLIINTNGRQNISFEYIGKNRNYIVSYNVEVKDNDIEILNLKNIL